MARHSNLKHTAITAGVIGVAGYLAGILTAPKSGKATRQAIKRALPADKADAIEKAKLLSNELNELIAIAVADKDSQTAKVLAKMNTVVGRAKQGRDKLENIIDAAKNGEANDHDLNRAVKEAEKAVVHFKKFMLKR